MEEKLYTLVISVEKNHVIAVIAPVLMDIIFLFLVSWSLFVIHSY